MRPSQDTVPRRRRRCVDEVRVVFLVPGVELKNQLTGARDPIVRVAVAVVRKRIGSEQFRVPATARPHIAYRNQRLRMYGRDFHL